MYETDTERTDAPTDDYPREASPSTDTFAVAEVNHAPLAHVVDAGEIDEEEEDDPEQLEDLIMRQDASTTLEVAL